MKKIPTPFLILFLNVLVYIIIASIRSFFGDYGTIEMEMIYNIFVSVAFSLLLLVIYFWGYKKIKSFPVSIILLGYLVFALILIITPVLNSMDIYMYPMMARIASVYGENPYLKTASDFSADPFYLNICGTWANLTEGYGMFWTRLSIFVSSIAPSNMDITYSLYKILGLIGNSIALFLVYLIGKLRKLDKLKIKKLIFLYAWNPVLLLEFINNAHNDVWMVVFGLLALYFYYKEKDLLILPTLLLAGLVKYAFWILVPIFLFFMIRKKRLTFSKLFYSSLICLIILLLLVIPFIQDFQGLISLIKKVDSNNYESISIGAGIFLTLILTLLSSTEIYTTEIFTFLTSLWGVLIFNLIFIICYVINLFLKKNIIKTIAISLLLFVIFIPYNTRPWYITWFLPFYILEFNHKQVVFWTTSAIMAYSILYSPSYSFIIIFSLFFLWFILLKIIRFFRQENRVYYQ